MNYDPLENLTRQQLIDLYLKRAVRVGQMQQIIDICLHQTKFPCKPLVAEAQRRQAIARRHVRRLQAAFDRKIAADGIVTITKETTP